MSLSFQSFFNCCLISSLTFWRQNIFPCCRLTFYLPLGPLQFVGIMETRHLRYDDKITALCFRGKLYDEYKEDCELQFPVWRAHDKWDRCQHFKNIFKADNSLPGGCLAVPLLSFTVKPTSRLTFLLKLSNIYNLNQLYNSLLSYFIYHLLYNYNLYTV